MWIIYFNNIRQVVCSLPKKELEKKDYTTTYVPERAFQNVCSGRPPVPTERTKHWQLAALLGNSVGKTRFLGPYPSLKQQWKISSICKWWTLHCYISSPKVYVRWCIPKAPTDIFTKKVNILHQLQNHLVTIRQRKTLMYQKKHNFH